MVEESGRCRVARGAGVFDVHHVSIPVDVPVKLQNRARRSLRETWVAYGGIRRCGRHHAEGKGTRRADRNSCQQDVVGVIKGAGGPNPPAMPPMPARYSRWIFGRYRMHLES